MQIEYCVKSVNALPAKGLQPAAGFDLQQEIAAITKKEFVKCLTKLTSCTPWCLPAPLGSVWGKAAIQKLQMRVCVTELPVQHLEKRKPADLGA